MDDIRITHHVDDSRMVYKFEVAITKLLDEKNVKNYVAELLTRVIQTAVMEKYADIQKLVDEVIFSSETKLIIKKDIRDKFSKITDKTINDIFRS